MGLTPLYATIEDFAAEGFTHVQCYCPRCRMIRLRPKSWLPRISMGLTIAQRHGCAVRSAVGRFTRSSRGDWTTCLATAWA
jgi:hypothetical protein